MESVVMPNMDDISYFGSTAYLRRGGIWADAARRERQPTTINEPLDPNVHLPQVHVETIPESLPTTLVSPPPPTQDPNLPAFLAEDQKDQDRERVGETRRKDESFETSSPPRSTASATSKTRSVSSGTTRRRSWFMPARDEEINTEPEPSLLHADGESSRGRPEQIAPGSPSSSRSASTHSDAGLASNSVPSEPSSLPKTPPPLPPRRELPPRPSELDDAVPPLSKSPTSLFGRVGSNASTNSNGSSTSSFFSTLKARAADKEALKDTAKETMKRWSANWANLRKGPSDEPAPAADDGQPKRSYAEIRKHVEERHRTVTPPGPSRESPPPHTQRGSRNLSMSGSFPTGPPIPDSDSANQSDSQEGLADQDETCRDREPETDVMEPHPHPIYTQPSAPKMMMIPGIHASHRGEVQSMGHVAPTPEPAEPKLKAPVIQSVYRLWKNPGSNQPTDPSHLEDGDFGSPSSQPSQDDPTMPTSSTSTSPNLKRQSPPPLPARPAAIRPAETSVTKASPDPAEFGNVSASEALKSIASLDNNSRTHSSSSFEIAENLQPAQTTVAGNS